MELAHFLMLSPNLRMMIRKTMTRLTKIKVKQNRTEDRRMIAKMISKTLRYKVMMIKSLELNATMPKQKKKHRSVGTTSMLQWECKMMMIQSLELNATMPPQKKKKNSVGTISMLLWG